MTVYIDADGCPVVRISAAIACENGLPCVIICDTAHEFNVPGARTVTVDKGADSADFRLANMIGRGDVAVTQDYGLAAMCLSRSAFVLSQNGLEYTADNIDALLESRAVAKKIRRAGGRLRGPSKRTAENDVAFASALRAIIARTGAAQ